MAVAAEYFLKAARMNTGEGSREKWLMIAALAGLLIAAFHLRRFAAFLLLWTPLPFYAYTIAHGSIPIFLPEWWPFSYYNVRYGLELLPALAVFAAVLPWAVTLPGYRRGGDASRLHILLSASVAVVLGVLVALADQSSMNCRSALSHQYSYGRSSMIPLCYREAYVNSRSRLQLETQVAVALRQVPADAVVMMYTANYVGAIQQAGIPFRRVVGESTRASWEAALSAPFAVADYVVAVDGDPVAEAVTRNSRGLRKLTIVHTLGKPSVTIYRSLRGEISLQP
jgi:hypothetical protein